MLRWIWLISECNLMTRDSRKRTPMGGPFMREHDLWKGGTAHHKSRLHNMCHTHSWPQQLLFLYLIWHSNELYTIFNIEMLVWTNILADLYVAFSRNYCAVSHLRILYYVVQQVLWELRSQVKVQVKVKALVLCLIPSSLLFTVPSLACSLCNYGACADSLADVIDQLLICHKFSTPVV